MVPQLPPQYPPVPPYGAAPYRLPDPSSVTPDWGSSPLMTLKEWSTVSVHPAVVGGESSNTTPSPWTPPLWVAPYRLPSASKVTPEYGLAPPGPPKPLVPGWKVCSTVSVHVPPEFESSKTRPQPSPPQPPETPPVPVTP